MLGTSHNFKTKLSHLVLNNIHKHQHDSDYLVSVSFPEKATVLHTSGILANLEN